MTETKRSLDWLKKFIPSRCFENGVYGVFSNPIGVDYDTIKPGLAMIVDPYGEIMAEAHSLDDEVVVALLTDEKLQRASGRQRYIPSRRPELYGKLVEPQESVTKPSWKRTFDANPS